MDVEHGINTIDVDDDGRNKRTGNVLTASAHIITAVIGSGVLSLAWAVAQMGWIVGPVVLLIFSFVTWFASTLQADCYRNPVTGKRHYTYREAVRSILGGRKYKLCALAQYSNFVGVSIGYTITASISMAAVKRAICFHYHGHEAGCHTQNNPYIIIFGVLQIILSQLPNFHKLSWLSIVSAAMSFGYSFIGIGLAVAKVATGSKPRTSLTGVEVGRDVTGSQKTWNIMTAMGNMAFAYAFSMVLIEIQDTLKPNPPENVVMKKAISFGVWITTFFYMLCGVVGYAAFGNDAPGNFLTGFGFYEPYWLVALANVFIAVHLVGAYQVFVQPLFNFVETQCSTAWPENKFITEEYPVKLPFYGVYHFNFLRVGWRTIYVIIVTIIAMIFPFFNDIVGLMGAFSFWPLTIYFPIQMYIAQGKVRKYSSSWIWLQILSFGCLIVSVLAAIASIRGLIVGVSNLKPFQSVS
ncbi:amino acid permease 6 [Beta vulgaris subsp. vulgaris]|uniref:amino acid permease 6 n=1 Tax=Beta vulgaris subsp. vulgaris TaxID=3555 RepID=UPI0025487078|nr:amino acid permease 6 [Beta vulgaris subsp. vulgaris]